jgi:hypothetical protein
MKHAACVRQLGASDPLQGRTDVPPPIHARPPAACGFAAGPTLMPSLFVHVPTRRACLSWLVAGSCARRREISSSAPRCLPAAPLYPDRCCPPMRAPGLSPYPLGAYPIRALALLFVGFVCFRCFCRFCVLPFPAWAAWGFGALRYLARAEPAAGLRRVGGCRHLEHIAHSADRLGDRAGPSPLWLAAASLLLGKPP